MQDDYALALTMLKWGVLYALGFCFGAALLTWVFASAMFGDGQYLMSFAFVSPLGWVIGVMIGAKRANTDATIPNGRKANVVAASLTGLGCLTMPIVGILVMGAFFTLLGMFLRSLS